MYQDSQFLKNKRAILFWIFLSISFPLAIIIIGYAAGYRINTNTRSVVESSAIAIETYPKEATILLNGKKQEQLTPFITTVPTGNYDIKIEKDNFLNWEKEISIQEGKAVIFPDIILFKKNVPLRIDNINNLKEKYISFTSLSNDEEKYYNDIGWYRSANLIKYQNKINLLVNTDTKSTYILSDIKNFNDQNKIDDVSIYAELNNNNILLILTKFELWIYNLKNDQLTKLSKQANEYIDAAWQPDGDYIFYSNDSGLYVIELDDRDHRQIWQLTELPSPNNIQINQSGNIVTFKSGQYWYELNLFE